jgi:THO complex subunit 1
MHSNGIIKDLGFLFGILEELFECQPKKRIEKMFYLLEEQILNKKVTDCNPNNTLLKICNGILKKLSQTHDTQFRGRIQLLISCIFPISERSGVNVNGGYNTGNQTTIEAKSSQPSQEYDFYHNFWTLQKYISNPFLVITYSRFSKSRKALKTIYRNF